MVLMNSSMKKTNYIIEYNAQIESGAVTVGKKIRKVYKKLVADVARTDWEWEYNEHKANHVIQFIQRYCKHSKGKMGGKPFKLEVWQKAMLQAAFGFVHKIDGVRKYRELILIVARKNGKSELGSAVALYMLMADGEPGPDVVSAATKKDQAKIIWSESKRMVKKSPTLNKRARCLIGEIVSDYNDGSFKPLSSDSNTLDGLNPHCSLIDELHAIEDRNLYDVIIDGMAAREQPMSIITSTAGTVREGIFDIKYDECCMILDGYAGGEEAYVDERVLPIIYELDSRDEWQDPAAWPKANPGLGTIKSISILTSKVNKAKANNALLKNLLCKDFNIRETVSEAWLPFDDINNPETFNVKELKPRYGIGGVDLSSCVDLTAACVLFMIAGSTKVYTIYMYWIPEDLVATREHDDKIPYSTWIKQGYIRTTPGNKVHYSFVTEWFREVQQNYDIYLFKCGYDRWSANYWVDEMKSLYGDNTMEPVAQGARSLSGPMKVMGADLASKMLCYGNNPVTKWCLSNTAITVDKNLNIQPCKTKNSRRRIDGTAATLDAYVVLEDHKEEYMALI